MKKILSVLLLLGSINSFAQSVQEYKTTCSVIAADSDTGSYFQASKTESFIQGGLYSIDFPSLRSGSVKTLVIKTSTTDNNLSYQVLISGLKKKDKVLALKIDIDGNSTSKDNEGFDRKNGLSHAVSSSVITKKSLINVRGTVSNKERTYLQVVECTLSPLELPDLGK